MLGYTNTDLNDMIHGLCGIETTPENVTAINKAIDFLQGLWAEGYFDNGL
jgi:hypothetical protein